MRGKGWTAAKTEPYGEAFHVPRRPPRGAEPELDVVFPLHHQQPHAIVLCRPVHRLVSQSINKYHSIRYDTVQNVTSSKEGGHENKNKKMQRHGTPCFRHPPGRSRQFA